MKGPFSWCVAAVVLSMLSPSAVAVTNDVMAQSPSRMDDIKYIDDLEVQDVFDENVKQAMEQDDTNFEEENEAVIETDKLEEAQVEGLDTNFKEENEAVIETDDYKESQVEGLESEGVVETNQETVEEKNEKAQEQFTLLGPLYRYWNSKSVDHFYTRNPHEIGTTTPGQRGKHGYVSEGIAIYLFTRRVHLSVPLYRYWRPHGADHFYTTNPHEIGTTVHGRMGRHGYISEGIVGYCYPRRYWKRHRYWETAPLYRYWKGHGTDHLYNSDCTEIGTTIPGQIGRFGYKYEGIQCYGLLKR